MHTKRKRIREPMSIRLLLGIACVLVFAAFTGCSSKPLKSDPNRARQLLEETLDAWKQGKSIDDLKSLSPPVYVGDERWQRGIKLTEFRILSDGEFFESSVKIPVSLRIAKETKAREVIYWVSTNPSLSVTLGE